MALISIGNDIYDGIQQQITEKEFLQLTFFMSVVYCVSTLYYVFAGMLPVAFCLYLSQNFAVLLLVYGIGSNLKAHRAVISGLVDRAYQLQLLDN